MILLTLFLCCVLAEQLIKAPDFSSAVVEWNVDPYGVIMCNTWDNTCKKAIDTNGPLGGNNWIQFKTYRYNWENKQSVSQEIDFPKSGEGILTFNIAPLTNNYVFNATCIQSVFKFKVTLDDNILYYFDENNETFSEMNATYHEINIPIKVNKTWYPTLNFIFDQQTEQEYNDCEFYLSLDSVRLEFEKDYLGTIFYIFIAFDIIILIFWSFVLSCGYCK